MTYLTAAVETETLMRQRGNLSCFLDTTQSPGILIDVAIGTIVMPEGQSTTVVSSPITDENAPWIFYSRFTVGYEEMVTDVVDVPQMTSYRENVDTKAMRILKPDQEIQLVIEQATLGGAGEVNLTLSDRILIGEH